MKTLAFFILLLYATNGIAQKTPSAYVIEEPVALDNHHPDTAAQNNLNKLLQLPPELTVVSCQLLYNSAGEIFKSEWSLHEPDKWATMQAFITRAKPKDKLTFTNIYVLKGDKRIRLAEKTIEIK